MRFGFHFLDFTLPNSATWFYLSLGLCVALFVQFNRAVSLRVPIDSAVTAERRGSQCLGLLHKLVARAPTRPSFRASKDRETPARADTPGSSTQQSVKPMWMVLAAPLARSTLASRRFPPASASTAISRCVASSKPRSTMRSLLPSGPTTAPLPDGSEIRTSRSAPVAEAGSGPTAYTS